jgi:protease-4
MRTIRWTLVALLVLAAIGYGVRRFAQPGIQPKSALLVELSGDYVEAPEPPLVAQLLGVEQHSLLETLSELRKAERDDRVANVVLVIRDLQIGWGKAQELREAIAALRDKGRHPVAYLEVGGFGANIEYYVASAAEQVYTAPGGGAPVIGLAQEFLFLGGLWDKLGVKVEVAQAGTYKGAAESIAGRRMSDAYREHASALLDSVDASFASGIAQSRGIEESAVRRALDEATSKPELLEELHLIDGVHTRREILESLGDPPVVKLADYARIDPKSLGFDPQASFALIYGSGTITTGRGQSSRSGRPVFASDTVVEAIEDAAKDDAMRAIVLRVDSPGGGAFPSELVWRALREARKKKPVIASFSDYAASGGYYVSSAADVIVSEPSTLTGSIGVFAVRPALAPLLQRLDVGVEVQTRAPHADLELLAPELSPATRAWLQADVMEVYHRFLSRVSEGRGIPLEALDALAEGRVWTGAQALDRKLVDALGGIRTAVAKAKEKVGLAPDADVSLTVFPAPKPLATQLREAFRVSVAEALPPALPLPRALAHLAGWIDAVSVEGPVLAPSVWIEIR